MSYETERRPVAAQNIERSGVHHSVHGAYWGWCAASPGISTSDSEEGKALREKIAAHVLEHDGENQNHGIELGYRYQHSPAVMGEDKQHEPAWSFRDYQPSTFPGARAPHVFLADGKTSIFDLFGSGNEYTLVDFTTSGTYGKQFQAAAEKARVPLKVAHLPDEAHVRQIWERDAVLLRPDDHVAWRLQDGEGAEATLADDVLEIATGWKASASSLHAPDQAADDRREKVFTGTMGNQVHEKVSDLAAFQR